MAFLHGHPATHSAAGLLTALTVLLLEPTLCAGLPLLGARCGDGARGPPEGPLVLTVLGSARLLHTLPEVTDGQQPRRDGKPSDGSTFLTSKRASATDVLMKPVSRASAGASAKLPSPAPTCPATALTPLTGFSLQKYKLDPIRATVLGRLCNHQPLLTAVGSTLLPLWRLVLE